jgi:hypothetical protein
MKKLMRSTFGRLFNKNLMLAATLICGATVFTSCSNSEDNPAPENAKNRKEFIKHTRENLKELAENLNFTSWDLANKVNQEFNTTVLNNPEFEKAILPLFTQKIREGIQPVEEGSELAEMGYKQYATIDLTKFNYRFTMKDDNSGFDVEEADDFEMIINGFNPATQQVEKGVRKLTLKASGDTYKQLAKRLGSEEMAVVILVPSGFSVSIASMVPGSWKDIFKGVFSNVFDMSGESEFINPKTDVIGITGVLTTGVPGSEDGQRAADATDLFFTIEGNPPANESSMKFSFEHNGKSMIELGAVAKYTDKETDFSQFTTSKSILDVLVAVTTGGSLEGTLTLNDDLTTEISINDCGKALQLQKEMAHARRNYADQATIEEYTKQLNGLVSAKMTCKGVNQVIPMKLQTEKFGVDYWAMPAFNFADEKGYVPITELLDKESVEYAINIVDHAAEPMAGSIITVRQLLQFVQTFIMQMRVNQAQAQAGNE